MARTRARRRAPGIANDNALVQAPAFEAPAHEAPAPDPLFLEEMVDVFLGAARSKPDEDEPPFDPPDEADLEAAPESEDDDPPFDPPEFEEPLLLSPPPGAAELLLEPANENPEPPRRVLGPARAEATPREQKLPALRVHASWDRPAIAELFAAFAHDDRCARAEISVDRGGIDAAIVRFSSEESPDLLLLDTTLRGAAMLAGLDRLAAVLAPETKIIVLGAVNDVPLLRELASRGIAEYIVPPIAADQLVRAACKLFVNADKTRVVAVIGARGGIGASTIAQNVAWSIAERQQVGAALVDLDLAFGAAAFSFNAPPSEAVAKIVAAAEDMDDAVDRLIAKPYPHLKLLTAPAALQQDFKLDATTLEALLSAVRRTSPYVVLDLPHTWNAWVKHALTSADEVLIVAGPDLASLRNADNMCRLLRDARPAERAPMIVLSMTGVPKRPEIPAKEFAEALGADPIASLTFDPALFGAAAMNAQMLAQVDPHARATATLDLIASAITGREPLRTAAPKPAMPPVYQNPERTYAVATQAMASAPAPANDALEAANENAPLPVEPKAEPEEAPLELVQPAPPEADPAIEHARAAAQAEAEMKASARSIGRRPRRLLWAASAAVMLSAIGAWQIMNHLGGAAPAPSQAAAATPLAAPAQVLAPEAALTRYSDIVARLEIEPGAAFADLQALAEQGYGPAQYHLAKLYETGEHAPLNLAQARQWTERAAAAGNVRAMHDLGVYYARGEGAALDEAAAFRWFRQAAEFDLGDSQYNLGILYEQGRGVTANAAEALFWFLLAARQGDADAARRAADLQTRVSPLDAEQARTRAQAFRGRTADPIANALPVSQASSESSTPASTTAPADES